MDININIKYTIYFLLGIVLFYYMFNGKSVEGFFDTESPPIYYITIDGVRETLNVRESIDGFEQSTLNNNKQKELEDLISEETTRFYSDKPTLNESTIIFLKKSEKYYIIHKAIGPNITNIFRFTNLTQITMKKMSYGYNQSEGKNCFRDPIKSACGNDSINDSCVDSTGSISDHVNATLDTCKTNCNNMADCTCIVYNAEYTGGDPNCYYRGKCLDDNRDIHSGCDGNTAYSTYTYYYITDDTDTSISITDVTPGSPESGGGAAGADSTEEDPTAEEDSTDEEDSGGLTEFFKKYIYVIGMIGCVILVCILIAIWKLRGSKEKGEGDKEQGVGL